MKRRWLGGMTLVEVMVAVVILGIVATVVFGGFDQTVRNKNRMEAETDRAHVLRVAMDRMVTELASAYVSLHVNPSTQIRSMNTCFIAGRRGRGHRIDFTSFSHQRLFRDAHESDQHEVSYFMTRHPDPPPGRRNQQVLARREQRRVDDDPQRGGTVQILVEDVRSFELEFLDPFTGEWISDWDASYPSGLQANRLPAQVKIRLVVPNPFDRRREQVFMTRAQPRIVWGLNHAIYTAGQ